MNASIRGAGIKFFAFAAPAASLPRHGAIGGAQRRADAGIVSGCKGIWESVVRAADERAQLGAAIFTEWIGAAVGKQPSDGGASAHGRVVAVGPAIHMRHGGDDAALKGFLQGEVTDDAARCRAVYGRAGAL